MRNELQEFLDEAYGDGFTTIMAWVKSRCFNWGFLKGSFPRGCVPSDCDGEIEINGHFLRFEMKYENCVRLDQMATGQRRQLHSLLNTGYFTVFIVGHDERHDTKCVRIWEKTPRGIKESYRPDCNNDDLRRLCETWVKRVENIMP